MKDTARVLGRMYDGIEYRGYGQEIVEELAKYAGVPVWNGLTNEFHPTQILADFLTMLEHSDKPLNKMSFCYLGDARYNMGNSLWLVQPRWEWISGLQHRKLSSRAKNLLKNAVKYCKGDRSKNYYYRKC